MNCLTLAWRNLLDLQPDLCEDDYASPIYKRLCGEGLLFLSFNRKKKKKNHSFCSFTANISRDKNLTKKQTLMLPWLCFWSCTTCWPCHPFIHSPRLRYHTHQWKEGMWWTLISLGKSSYDRETVIWLKNILKWLSWLFVTQKNGV